MHQHYDFVFLLLLVDITERSEVKDDFILLYIFLSFFLLSFSGSICTFTGVMSIAQFRLYVMNGCC